MKANDRTAKGQWVDLQAERRELYNGFGNAMSLGIEFALGPVIFGGIGWLLDRWIGISPILTVLLAIVGIVAAFVRTWYRYDTEMKVKESEAVWHKYSTSPKVGSASPPRKFASRLVDEVPGNEDRADSANLVANVPGGEQPARERSLRSEPKTGAA